MLYAKMDINGNITESKEIDQSTLTSDCWLIQFEGLKACESCEVRDTEECGGVAIRKYLLKETKHV